MIMFRFRPSSLIILSALALLGCDDPPPPAPGTSPTARPAAMDEDGPDVAEPSQTVATPAQTPSVPASGDYTSLEDCPVIVSEPDEAGYSVRRCQGLAGYSVETIEADGRQDIALVSAAGRRPLNLPGIVGSGFSTLGPRLEWRVPDATGVPKAMIVRVNVSENPNAPAQTTSFLVVVRLADGCTTQRVSPGPDQNVTARRLADGEDGCRPAEDQR